MMSAGHALVATPKNAPPLCFPLRLEAMGTMKELLPNCLHLHGKL